MVQLRVASAAVPHSTDLNLLVTSFSNSHILLTTTRYMSKRKVGDALTIVLVTLLYFQQCSSPAILNAELEAVRAKVSLEETEESWDKIEQGIVQLTQCCNNGGCDFATEMVAGIRSLSRPINHAMNSERSRLSGSAIELMNALLAGLGSSFEPLVSLFMPTLLGLCGRTNKVFTSRAKACILAVIENTQLPSILPYLADSLTQKSAFLRLVAAEGVLACLNCFNPPDIEKDTRARLIEDIIKLTARDASADVRRAGKMIFEAYKALLPDRVERLVSKVSTRDIHA